MEYRSDYLGRMQWILYPDGEKVTYGYDRGGQVVSVTGKYESRNEEFTYVTDILYDQYGQRTRIDYGNGTFTEYKYDPARRWLDTIKTQNKWGQSYQNISYSFDRVGNVSFYENNCLDNVNGNYKTRQKYTYDSLYQLIKAEGFTSYNPYSSSVPEFESEYTQEFEFDADGLGNMMSKISTETVTPQKTIGDNLNYSFNYVYDKNYAHRLLSAGDRYYQYDSNGNVTCEQDGNFDEEDVEYHRATEEADGVYSSDYAWAYFKDSKKKGSESTRYHRTYAWDEKNRLINSTDSSYNTSYVYGQDGQRSNKYTQSSETLYFNKMWTFHTDSGNSVYGGQTAKNIYLGETRIVTKLNSGTTPTYQEEFYKQYYYHSDHLGSASLISDYKGDEYQRIEYTPYGETWVEKTENTGLEFLPYKFTAKEQDEETGLYYYGARYLDSRYSRWISTDPALGDYIPQAPVNDEAKKNNQNLPGMGGIFNHVNNNLYHYAANNPVKYTDPNGCWTVSMANAVKTVIDNNKDKTYTHGSDWNKELKRFDDAWDCDSFVERIITTPNSGASLPDNWNGWGKTVPEHLKEMKSQLKDAPEKGTNIVFHGGNHAMLLGLNEDGSVDMIHVSSGNSDKKAKESHWASITDFENYWSKIGNGELKYVPLNDFTDQNKSNVDTNKNSGGEKVEN